MKPRLPAILTLLFCLALPPAALAQEKADKAEQKTPAVVMDEMVISATRTEKKVDEAPTHVTVISREEMRRREITAVDEALKWEAGVYAKRRKGVADHLSEVSLRGLPGDERTLIMLNGLPLNDGYSSQVPWNHLNVDDVERIEVIRGPGSALYGGNAMGGVVNIVTSAPKEREIMARFGVGYLEGDGDPNIFKYGLSVGDALGDFSLRLGLDLTDSEGYATDLVSKTTSAGAGVPNSGYGVENRTTGAGNWVVGDKGDNATYRESLTALAQYALTEDSALRVDILRGHSQYSYNDPKTYLESGSFRGRAQANDGFRTGVIRPRDFAGGRGKENQLTTALTYTNDLGKIDLSAKAGYSHKRKIYSSYASTDWDGNAVDKELSDQPGSLVDSDSFGYFLDVQADHAVTDEHTLTYGVYFRMDDYLQDEDWLERFQDWESHHSDKDQTMGKARQYAVFVQDEWSVTDEVTLYGGARFDYWEAIDGQSGLGGATVKHSDHSDNAVSPKAAVVWHPLEDSYLRTSVGRAFRAPNLYEMYRTWTSTTGRTYFSNPKLKPEILWNYEVGGDQYFFERRLKLSATWFHTDIEDMIDSRTLANGDTEKQNLGKVRIDGWELGASVHPWDWLGLWGNWTILDTEIMEFDANEAAVGNELAGIPLETINLGADLTWDKITFSVVGSYQGRNYYDEMNDDVANTYTSNTKVWLWDAKVAYAPCDHFEMSASVTNVFDEMYYAYYVGQPRAYYLEAKVRF